MILVPRADQRQLECSIQLAEFGFSYDSLALPTLHFWPMDVPTALLFVGLGIWILARAWHARQRAQRTLAWMLQGSIGFQERLPGHQETKPTVILYLYRLQTVCAALVIGEDALECLCPCKNY